MIPLSLCEIAAAVGGVLVGRRRPVGGSAGSGDGAAGSGPGPGNVVVEAVSTDTRRLRPGSLFVALPGENADGHDFVADAAEAGAAALLVAREVGTALPAIRVDDTWEALARLGGEVRRRVDPLVVAVTGSVGKTTTKDLAAAAVGAGRRTVAARGSFNNELGVPLTLLSLRADTEVLVTELGSRGVGDIARLAPLVGPEIGIVTRVAGVHLERFGDLETVARAKAELVEALPRSGFAVLCADDRRVAAMAGETAADALLYSAAEPRGGADDAPARRPDVWAEGVALDRYARASLTARTPWGSVAVRLPVAGRHHVGNALAALAAAALVGVPPEAAGAALAAAPVSDWRGEVDEVGGVVVLNDAYNASPTSVVAALETLVAVGGDGRRWAVLGVMAEIGPEHERAHRRVGRRAAELGVDRLVVVGEDAAAMAAGAGDAGLAEVTVVADAAAAVEQVLGGVAPGDAVLVKASRAAGLEVVAARLTARLGEEAA